MKRTYRVLCNRPAQFCCGGQQKLQAHASSHCNINNNGKPTQWTENLLNSVLVSVKKPRRCRLQMQVPVHTVTSQQSTLLGPTGFTGTQTLDIGKALNSLTFSPGCRAPRSVTHPASVHSISTASCQYLSASPAPKMAWRSPKLTWFAKRILRVVVVPIDVEAAALATSAPPRACFRLKVRRICD
jgi:hypothetical protein